MLTLQNACFIRPLPEASTEDLGPMWLRAIKRQTTQRVVGKAKVETELATLVGALRRKVLGVLCGSQGQRQAEPIAHWTLEMSPI
jgi:hypothetical protein